MSGAVVVINRLAAAGGEPGFWTAAGRYGSGFVLDLPGVTRISR